MQTVFYRPKWTYRKVLYAFISILLCLLMVEILVVTPLFAFYAFEVYQNHGTGTQSSATTTEINWKPLLNVTKISVTTLKD